MKAEYEFHTKEAYKKYLRAYYAGLAMQGLLASDWGKKMTSEGTADLMTAQIMRGSIVMADELLKALEVTNEQ